MPKKKVFPMDDGWHLPPSAGLKKKKKEEKEKKNGARERKLPELSFNLTHWIVR